MQLTSSQKWHSVPLETVLGDLHTTINGLTQFEANRRYVQVGPNRLPQPSPPSHWQILLRQFRSPLIYILGLAVCVSAVIGDMKDAGFILVVLVLNAAIGGYQEWRAEQSSRALQQLLKMLVSRFIRHELQLLKCFVNCDFRAFLDEHCPARTADYPHPVSKPICLN